MSALKPYKSQVSSIVKRFLRASAILMALILISITFTFFKPIDVESIGYQYYNDKTYRVEKTNQFRNLLHGELIIRQKVNVIREQTTDPKRQIDLALSWVTQYVRPQDASPSPVISDDYYNILKRGSGYCDQAAYVFSVLSNRLGIPAHMIMLRDRDGISHHTAAEVYLDDKWQYIDPWLGVFPHKPSGTAYTRLEFAKDQSALEKYGYAPGLTGYEFANSVVFETFPFMSFSKLIQKIVRRLGNSPESSATSPGGVNNVAKFDAEATKVKVSEEVNVNMSASQLEILSLYDKARSRHLDEDFIGARAIYQSLVNNSQIATIRDSARFLLGVTHFDQHRYTAAEKYFKQAIAMQPNDLWRNSEYRYLSESLIAQGKIEEAKIWLKKSTSQGDQARLKNLDKSLSNGLDVPFVSY